MSLPTMELVPDNPEIKPFFCNELFWRVIRIFFELAGEDPECEGRPNATQFVSAGQAKAWGLILGNMVTYDIVNLAIFRQPGAQNGRMSYLVPHAMKGIFLEAARRAATLQEPNQRYEVLLRKDVGTGSKVEFYGWEPVAMRERKYLERFSLFLKQSNGFTAALSSGIKVTI